MGDDDRIAAIITALELMVDLLGGSHADELINLRMNSIEDQSKRVAAEKVIDDAAMNAGRRSASVEVSNRLKLAGQKFKGLEVRIQEVKRILSVIQKELKKGKDDNGHQNAGNGSNHESDQAGTEVTE